VRWIDEVLDIALERPLQPAKAAIEAASEEHAPVEPVAEETAENRTRAH
jgi:ATP-dependent Lon protease